MDFVAKLCLIAIIFTNTAQARFMIEVKAIGQSGIFTAGENDGTFQGSGAGLNLGYLGKYFMIGFSGERLELEFDKGLDANNYEKYRAGGLGTYLGFHFFDRIQIQTTYMNSTLEPFDNDSFRYFGQYVSFGIGYRLYKGLILNLEAFRNQYTQQEDDETGKTQGLDSNIKTEGKNIGLSYLLAF